MSPSVLCFCVGGLYLDNPNNTYGKLVVEQQEGKINNHVWNYPQTPD